MILESSPEPFDAQKARISDHATELSLSRQLIAADLAVAEAQSQLDAARLERQRIRAALWAQRMLIREEAA